MLPVSVKNSKQNCKVRNLRITNEIPVAEKRLATFTTPEKQDQSHGIGCRGALPLRYLGEQVGIDVSYKPTSQNKDSPVINGLKLFRDAIIVWGVAAPDVVNLVNSINIHALRAPPIWINLPLPVSIATIHTSRHEPIIPQKLPNIPLGNSH